MPISFGCDQCGRRMQTSEDRRGQETSCLTCGAPVTVPTPSGRVKLSAPGEDTRADRASEPRKGSQRASRGRSGSRRTRAQSSGERPSARPASLPEGTAFAGYVLTERLGRGAFGEVHEAWDETLGVKVAIKILTSLAPTEKDQQRFRREARTLAALSHPNIVRVFATGIEEGRPYLAMEYVAGESLAELARKKPLRPEEAARILRDTARAIAHAHDQKVVHRDIKPDNIVVGSDDKPRVLDFGLALSEVAGTKVTKTGQGGGTPAYMPPEQGRNRRVGPTADVYALGATLYHALTARPPFVAETAVNLAVKVHKEDPTPPSARNRRVPVDLDRICLKCLEKSPQHRYASAEALADDLDRFLAGEPVSARPPGVAERVWRKARRNPLVSGLVGAVCLSLLGGVAVAVHQVRARHRVRQESLAEIRRQRDEARRQRAEAERQRSVAERQRAAAKQAAAEADDARAEAERQRAEAQRQLARGLWEKGRRAVDAHRWQSAVVLLTGALTKAPNVSPRRRPLWRALRRAWTARALRGHGAGVNALAWSPSGRRLATASGDATVRVWDPAEPAKPRTTLEGHTGAILDVAWTPDGRFLATGSHDRTVRVWNPEEPQRPVAILEGHTDQVDHLAWSADGRFLATGSHDRTVRVWNPEEPQRPVATLEDLAYDYLDVAWSPNGRLLATASLETIRVWRPAAPGDPGAVLESHDARVNDMAWSPDGHRFASASSDDTIRVWDPDKPHRVVATLQGHSDDVLSVAWSPTGRRLASASDDGTLRVWDPAAPHRAVVTLRDHSDDVTDVAWSPDGRRLASASEDATVRVWDLAEPHEAVVALEGQSGAVWHVAWSPDGSHLVSASPRDDTIWVWAPPEFEGPVVTLPSHDSDAFDVAWSPDGRYLASAFSDGTAQVWDTASPEEPLVRLENSPSRVFAMDWSPKGKSLAIASRTVRLWAPFESEEPVATLEDHTRGVTDVAWSPGGRRLVGACEDEVRVWAVADRKALQRTFHGHTGTVLGVAWSPDGRRLASASRDNTIRLWDPGNPEEPVATLEGHTQDVQDVAWSPDRRRLASGSWDGTVRLWRPSNSKGPVATFESDVDIFHAVAWRPNGRGLLAAAAHAGTVWVWDVGEEKRPVAVVGGHAERVSSVAWSPDGRRLASASWDGTVRIVDLEAWLQPGERLYERAVERTGLRLDGIGVVPSPTAGPREPAEGEHARSPGRPDGAPEEEPDEEQGAKLPDPVLTFQGTEDDAVRGQPYTRYELSVTNWSDYPDAIFQPAPDLPPVGSNDEASRTTVDICAEGGNHLYGFVALDSAKSLDALHFALPRGAEPPDRVYVTIEDRRRGVTRTSNLVSIR